MVGTRGLLGYGAAAVALCATYALLPTGPVRSAVFVIASLVGAAAVLRGAVLPRAVLPPTGRRGAAGRAGWALVAAAVLSWGLGDLVYQVYAELLDRPVPLARRRAVPARLPPLRRWPRGPPAPPGAGR
ncbi:hypothetical protein [uncultured Pseudokineococcus sp.]|uniref:hypothetical protein n=1 Tax=uncultured Pseudokineococcus sp. TaxID=1642928 RepID=UPI002634A193|nr:hypothetical protein [uncultured Pseudokineococcus sp.]